MRIIVIEYIISAFLCLAALNSFGFANDSQITDKLFKQALHVKQTNPQSALMLLDSCIANPKNSNNPELVSNCYFEKGQIYKELNLHNEAIVYFNMALPYSEINKITDQIAMGNYLLGYCNYELGNFDQSINNLNLAIHLFDSLKNYKLQHTALNALASNLIYLNNLDLANEIYLKVKQYAEESHDTLLLAKSYANLAIVTSFDSTKYEPTTEYYQKAITFFLVLNNVQGASNVYMNLGVHYIDHKKYKDGYKCLKIAKELNDNSYSPNLDIHILNGFSYLFLQLGNLDSTIFYANKTIEKSIELGYYQLLPESYHTISQIYKKKGAFELALQNSENALSWKDTIWKKELIETTAKLENKFESQKQTIEINLKQATIEKQNLKIKNQRQRTILMGIVVIIFGILLGITLSISKKLTHTNTVLNDKNLIIRDKNIKLEAAIATRDKLTSIIAHDIRNPLATIAGISDVIALKQSPDGLSKISFYGGQIRLATQNLFELLDNLLEWIRVQKEGIKIKKEPLKINQLVEKNIELLKIIAVTKQINVENNCLENELIYADKLTLNTIIRNILNNALKFTPNNGLITISCENNKMETKIHIKDTGVGISETDIQKIFDPADDKSLIGNGKNKGVGLGLNLCVDFAELNGGFITVESELNNGSCFTIHLPQENG